MFCAKACKFPCRTKPDKAEQRQAILIGRSILHMEHVPFAAPCVNFRCCYLRSAVSTAFPSHTLPIGLQFQGGFTNYARHERRLHRYVRAAFQVSRLDQSLRIQSECKQDPCFEFSILRPRLPVRGFLLCLCCVCLCCFLCNE